MHVGSGGMERGVAHSRAWEVEGDGGKGAGSPRLCMQQGAGGPPLCVQQACSGLFLLMGGIRQCYRLDRSCVRNVWTLASPVY